MVLIMVAFALSPSPSQAQTDGSATGDCSLVEGSIYKDSLSLEGMISLYHETMNKKFNEYIARMISQQSEAAKSSKVDPDGFPPKEGEVCTEQNYSTFCIAQTLLTNKSYGHTVYRQALRCRKNSLVNGIQDKSTWDQWTEINAKPIDAVAGTDYESTVSASLLTQRAVQASTRLKVIDMELSASKETLDQTLSAYDALRTAWPMHQKYMAIYQSLLKYRDKMSEIRHQTDQFPSKFIDATTTQCN